MLCQNQIGFKIAKSFLQVSWLVYKKEKGVIYLVIGEFWSLVMLSGKSQRTRVLTGIESKQNWLNNYFLYGNYWCLIATVLMGFSSRSVLFSGSIFFSPH